LSYVHPRIHKQLLIPCYPFETTKQISQAVAAGEAAEMLISSRPAVCRLTLSAQIAIPQRKVAQSLLQTCVNRKVHVFNRKVATWKKTLSSKHLVKNTW